ncbi:Alginate export [Neorhodopirellula lusitana]|uniref:Alginate export n=1 Tax=Neorhodopirellula lusitana TaxID=445327 RepID=A0ABY1QIA6_9BACT|nr:alginate export family protein [Neorhodopirellula lusitana]SMP71793.1 Alginate export [Neorhodopirellula lusitana]
MSRRKTQHRRLLLAALSMAIAGFQASDGHAQGIDESGLETVIVQTSMTESQPYVAESVVPSSASDQPAAATYEGTTQSYPVEMPVQESSYVPSYSGPSQAAIAKKKKAAMAGFKGAYQGVYFNNNFAYLDDPYYDGPRFFSDNFKNMKTPLGTLSLGGETRYRFHDESNFRGKLATAANGGGITGNHDDFWLSRQRVYADWRPLDCLRVYGEVLEAKSFGETFAPRGIEENDFDIQNLFVDALLFDNDYGKLTARVGRQELLFGAQRTVSPLDWANTRRTFEGVRGLYSYGDTSVDAFWTEFVPVDADGTDKADSNQQFYGAYLTEKNTSLGQVEAYYLGFDNDTVGFSDNNIGGRLSGSTSNKMLYDVEGAYQFGENADGSDHSAGFFTVGLGRKIETKSLSPTVMFYYDYASGEDDFADVGRGDNGYDHLFPLAHKYNGFMDLFGRRNLHDFNILTTAPINEKVSFLVWYHYFRMVEDTTPYNVGMAPYDTTTAAQSKDLGHEIDFLMNVNFTARHNVVLGYSHFAGGSYYDDPAIGPANENNDADFFYAQFTTRY